MWPYDPICGHMGSQACKAPPLLCGHCLEILNCRIRGLIFLFWPAPVYGVDSVYETKLIMFFLWSHLTHISLIRKWHHHTSQKPRNYLLVSPSQLMFNLFPHPPDFLHKQLSNLFTSLHFHHRQPLSGSRDRLLSSGPHNKCLIDTRTFIL